MISNCLSSIGILSITLAICHIKTGGTALPIALYCLFSDTDSILNVSGNDYILAASVGVNLLYLSLTINTGSVLLRLAFDKWELIVLHGDFRS